MLTVLIFAQHPANCGFLTLSLSLTRLSSLLSVLREWLINTNEALSGSINKVARRRCGLSPSFRPLAVVLREPPSANAQKVYRKCSWWLFRWFIWKPSEHALMDRYEHTVEWTSNDIPAGFERACECYIGAEQILGPPDSFQMCSRLCFITNTCRRGPCHHPAVRRLAPFCSSAH